MSDTKLDDMIAILQAAKAGKQIQGKYRLPSCRDNEWFDVRTIECIWDDHVYRVKPEPREGWIAPEWLRPEPLYDNWLKVKEVLP